MPRGFSESEKEHFRAKLLEQGREFLTTYGVKKTSVDDLTNAVGISKGAFYLFFPSKEELFLTIFDQLESDYQAELLRLARQFEGVPRERLAAFFQRAFSLWRESPLFRHFGQEEFAYLARRAPPERLAANLNSDQRFATLLLARWRDQGLNIDISVGTFTGLMRALFFVSLHADDIGDAYPATIELLIDTLAERLAP
jgi:AcrR family transcriptional regulator